MLRRGNIFILCGRTSSVHVYDESVEGGIFEIVDLRVFPKGWVSYKVYKSNRVGVAQAGVEACWIMCPPCCFQLMPPLNGAKKVALPSLGDRFCQWR